MISVAWEISEFNKKLQKVRALLKADNTPAVLVGQQINLFWLTGARGYVNMFGDKGCFDILVTLDDVYLVTNNIEYDRLQTEELNILKLKTLRYNWWNQDAAAVIAEVLPPDKVKTDLTLPGFAALRYMLTADEIERFKDTAACTAKALDEVAVAINPGDSEKKIATMIRAACMKYGVAAFVCLVGTDDRAYKYRHPLPTFKKLDKYALMAVSGRKYGMYASVTRQVHFGALPDELAKRQQAVQEVDAAFILSTVAGAKVSDIFTAGVEAYQKVGYSNEWQYHHQGGLAGYNSREFRGTADCAQTVSVGQVFAWNPTIAGAKSEDSILITQNGPEILTKSNYYPQRLVEYKGQAIARSEILII